MSRTAVLRSTFIALLAILLGAGGGLLAHRMSSHTLQAAKIPLRILFIGNSYTYVNDLPVTVSQLASAGGHPIDTAMDAPGGWTLAQHVASPDTLKLLRQEKWDYVGLQEQSQIPASASARSQGMYPAVRRLVAQIRGVGAKPLLFLTWGHRDGWPEAGLWGYAAMQSQLTAGYLEIANELQIPVAPVGEAWRRAQAFSPPVGLWQGDGSHPTVQGTYLASCVFYATIFRQSPVGLSYGDGLVPSMTRTLQSLAATTVLADPRLWNLS